MDARTTTPTAAPASFRELLGSFQHEVEGELLAWLAAKRGKVAEEISPQAAELVDELSGLVEGGGKRLRPALVYFTYRGLGGRRTEAALKIALSTELLHAYLLVHDDIMDHAETRRGRPAAHTSFRRRHLALGWPGDAADFGRSAAILAGDLAYSYAVELFLEGLAEGADDAPPRPPLHRTFTSMCEEVIGGQYLEMILPFRADPGEEELLRVLRLKSGRYSVERPIELGARLAGAPQPVLEALGRYGRAVGEAFQLGDDILGTFGDAETVGKPVGSDLKEGKLTVLVHHALRLAAPQARQRLRTLLGRPDLGSDEIGEARAILRDSGALAAVEAMIDNRFAEAREALAGLDLEPAGRGFLEGLVEFLRERDL